MKDKRCCNCTRFRAHVCVDCGTHWNDTGKGYLTHYDFDFDGDVLVVGTERQRDEFGYFKDEVEEAARISRAIDGEQ